MHYMNSGMTIKEYKKRLMSDKPLGGTFRIKERAEFLVEKEQEYTNDYKLSVKVRVKPIGIHGKIVEFYNVIATDKNDNRYVFIGYHTGYTGFSQWVLLNNKKYGLAAKKDDNGNVACVGVLS